MTKKRIWLIPVIGDEDLRTSVAIHVFWRQDPHAGTDLPVLVIARARGVGDIVKGAVASVNENKIGTDIVGDIEIGPAVIVQVDRDHSQPTAIGPPPVLPRRMRTSVKLPFPLFRYKLCRAGAIDLGEQ